MNSFDHMVFAIQTHAKYAAPATIEVAINPNKTKIAKAEYEDFYKEFIFEKLKGKTLAECFSHKFSIYDILFEISMSDEATQVYIENYYIK